MAPEEYRFNWHHDLFYSRLDAFARGEVPKLIVQMPPGHTKSEGCSRNLPAYLFGRNPDERVMACSYSSDLAGEMNRDVQRIMDSESYRAVFPGTKLAPRGGTQRAGSRRNNKIFDIVGRRGYYKCAGVGQGITGRRFDVGIIDDPIKDRKEANSPTLREAIWRWYTGVFLTRRARNARILITLTRWHEDDLVGRLLDREPGQWEVIRLPALATGIDPHPRDPRKIGEALWPWLLSAEELEKIAQVEPRDFWALYQQDPRKEGGQEWPDDWFGKDLWFDEWPKDLLFKVLALDPSKGKDSKHGDYAAFVLLGMDRDKTLWVDAWLGRWPTPRIVEVGMGIFTDWDPVAFAIEINQFQELLGGEFGRAAKAAGLISMPLFGITNTITKEVRIRQLGPFLGKKQIRFKANSPGTRLLVKQLQEFPVGDHDDGPDALQMALVMLTAMLRGRGRGPGQPQVLTV